ncbi:MAG: c-type cytochrome [Halochromatium sp.]|uniref:c-type cytochrome n=1 Tax=Halochromatium sp. TaxID=2049430 RepID=UPI00397CB313
MNRTMLVASATLVGCALALPLLVETSNADPAGSAADPAAETPTETPVEIARREYEEVLRQTPDVERGREVYLTCAVCHLPEGWGSADGRYPQIAGQLRTVIIKQLADFRAGNRENPLMYPFSVPGILGGPQEIADVAAYVSQLPMTADNGLGPGTDLEAGEALYIEHCADCHGAAGEGDEAEHIPMIAGQHFVYLMRQFDAIRSGERKNADAGMIDAIQELAPAEQEAVLDYTARLRPAAEKLAQEGWLNPDFPHYLRDAMGLRARPPAVQWKEQAPASRSRPESRSGSSPESPSAAP